MKNNISIIQQIRKQKTMNHHVQFPNDFNKKVDLIIKRTKLLEKKKK